MIKAKTHKAKSDKETIIDMEPVNETQKTIILKNPIFLIPFITVFSFIIILIWLTVYYLPNHIEQQSNKITQLNNEIEALKDKENIKINEINTEIKLLKNKLNTLDFNTSETINLEIKNQGNSLLLIKEELDKISNKIKILENKTETANKEKEKNNNSVQVKNSYEPIKFSQNIVKSQIEKWKINQINQLIYEISEIELQVKKNYDNAVNIVIDFIFYILNYTYEYGWFNKYRFFFIFSFLAFFFF